MVEHIEIDPIWKRISGHENNEVIVVEQSRTGRSGLAAELGEQIREAVAILVAELPTVRQNLPHLWDSLRKNPDGSEIAEQEMLEALLHASSRLVMRVVVALFAESRGLLPERSSDSQGEGGLDGLFEQLRRAAEREGEQALAERHAAWPRMLALSRRIGGAGHRESLSDIPDQAGGGLLFQPGDANSPEPVRRALDVFEHPLVRISDRTVYRLLEKIRLGKEKSRGGSAASRAEGPVDFSALPTEYIGMMYEGLLDVRLLLAREPMLVLNLGHQPVLPLAALEKMTDKELKDLLKQLMKGKEGGTGEEVWDGEAAETDGEPAWEEDDGGDRPLMAAEPGEAHEPSRQVPVRDEGEARALAWAKRAAQLGGWGKKPPGNKIRATTAKRLVQDVLPEGAFYLARWGGTRKGSGTFYTKPGLAAPTVHRTLEPLVYTRDASGERIPREPEAILSLKVCDPACGSGSFLLAALRYLTDGLYRSLLHYGRLRKTGKGETAIQFARSAQGDRTIEPIVEVPPGDAGAEDRVKRVLKRLVAERCLYGVDLNPMAVELAKLSLWIETMDRELPLTFLDHRIKAGNALVGCWLDRFRDYPALAWLREGGDQHHHNGVHHQKGAWTRAIKQFREERVKPELVQWIESRAGQGIPAPDGVSAVSKDARMLQRLKEAFDTWCAVWFWPADRLDEHTPSPLNFGNLSEEARQIVRKLAEEHRFFHWELEFPEVFSPDRSGFDAVIGNPPWDVSKPLAREFFTNHDPHYLTHGKQEAIRQQRRLFERKPEVEEDWIRYQAQFQAMSNWVANAARPFGDGKHDGGAHLPLIPRRKWESDRLHRMWRELRETRGGRAGKPHPFLYQGSADINKYKLFVELSHALLTRGGRMGLVVPSGIYADKGCADLRTLLLEHNSWEWVFGFENRHKVFAIDSRFKFCCIIAGKSGQTETLQTAFMHVDLHDWEQAERHVIPYSAKQVSQFSPHSKALLEVRHHRDLEILEKMYAHSVLLGDTGGDGWGIAYAREFDMTHDSHLFTRRSALEAKGFRPDAYGRWMGPDGEVMLPLYEGRMIGQFDFSQKGWVRGTGRSAVWREIPFERKVLEPQYLVRREDYRKKGQVLGPKLAIMSIASATNERTMIAAMIPDLPCGHSVALLKSRREWKDQLVLLAILNSFAFDFFVRIRLSGLNLSFFVLEESPLVQRALIPTPAWKTLLDLSARLAMPSVMFAPCWVKLKEEFGYQQAWKSLWAVTEPERLRLRCILDAIVAELYGLDVADLEWMLRNDETHLKGFWRVDKDKPAELRHTTLTLQAFRRLKEVGMEQFCAEDWQLPADAARRLGPRQLKWQTEQSPEASWAECEHHARQMLGGRPPACWASPAEKVLGR